MQQLKNILVSGAVAVITAAVMFGGWTIYAETKLDPYLTFTNPADGFDLVQNAYHKAMNQYFNDKMDNFLALIEQYPDDFFNQNAFKAPDTAAECTENNVSSYCVGLGAMELYLSYMETLVEMQDFVPVTDGTTQAEKFAAVEARDAKIEAEIEEARTVMEAAVGIYDEYRLSYPVHIRYEKVITSLRKYQIALEKVRFQVEGFPIKLIDSTSAYCE